MVFTGSFEIDEDDAVQVAQGTNGEILGVYASSTGTDEEENETEEGGMTLWLVLLGVLALVVAGFFTFRKPVE